MGLKGASGSGGPPNTHVGTHNAGRPVGEEVQLTPFTAGRRFEMLMSQGCH